MEDSISTIIMVLIDSITTCSHCRLHLHYNHYCSCIVFLVVILIAIAVVISIAIIFLATLSRHHCLIRPPTHIFSKHLE